MGRVRLHLSPAGERLLADLMSPSPSLQQLRFDLSEYVMQFTVEGPGISMLQLFTAIGNCCTLRTVDLSPVFVDLPSRSGSVYLEMMALLTGLVANPVLEVLDLGGCEAFEEDAACVALAALVRSNSRLHTLGLSGVRMTCRGLGEIGAALPNSRVRVLDLDVISIGKSSLQWGLEDDTSGDMLAQHMAHIVANTPSIKELGMLHFPLTVSGAKLVADALRHNTTLRQLRIGTPLKRRLLSGWTGDPEEACLSILLAALGSSTSSEGIPNSSPIRNHSINELQLQLQIDVTAKGSNLLNPRLRRRLVEALGEALVQVLRTNTILTSLTVSRFFLEPGGGLEALLDNTSITRLRLDLRDFEDFTLKDSPDVVARLIPILEKSKTLQELDLTMVRQHSGWPAEFGRGFIRSLKHNPSVTVLILDGWDFLDDGLLQDLLESLRYNTNLKRISIENTPWKSQGKETTIRQALRQVAYLSVLKKHADITCTPPKSGRLFLCGPGYAGKTTLRGSLIGSWKKSRPRKKCIPRLRAGVGIMASPRRTEGIEIEVLREDDKMRVTIWDLAGQDTFRILQQHLFPTISQACIFFLVFSPFDQGTGQVKRDWEEDLQVQLRDWLRFITSNTSTKLHGSIEAYVILTHLDKMSDFTSVTMKDFATPSIQTVTRVFDGVLEGGPESVQVFALNCKSERDVAPLLDDVFFRFEQLLGNKLLLVPEPCTDMSIVLAKWTSKHPNKPIMRLEEFYALCRSKVVALQDPARQADLPNPVQDAISSYLHDVGVIMFFKDLRFLVVNPNWVTHIPTPGFRRGSYMIIEAMGKVWVAGWVRAARPDLTDACTHGLALPLLSLASRTWFPQGTERPVLWVEWFGDAIVVSEEARNYVSGGPVLIDFNGFTGPGNLYVPPESVSNPCMEVTVILNYVVFVPDLVDLSIKHMHKLEQSPA